MYINCEKDFAIENSSIVSCSKSRGLVSADILVALLLTGTIAGLAAGTYRDAVEKHLIINGADQIAAFIGSVQSHSVTRNRRAHVSYDALEDGTWCIGATHDKAPCDCLETDSTQSDFCALESSAWILRNSDVQARNLIQFAAGEGAFAFDPVRRLLEGPFDSMVLGLQSGDQKFQMELRVNALGRISKCLHEGSEEIRQYDYCPVK